MLHILTHDILPVFFMLALGFAMGRAGKASEAEARALNRIAFLVLQPALIFPLVAGFDLAGVNLAALGLYVLCQAATFALTVLVSRRLFRRDIIRQPWAPQVLPAAAGPSGAMAFSLALLYGVRTDAIAPVVIWTSVLSLLSLAALA